MQMNYYDEDGNELSSNENAVAKSRLIVDENAGNNKNKRTFFILYDTYGMYDPLTATKSRTVTKRYRWQMVTEDSFKLYLSYLKTRKLHFYNQARREA